MPQLNEIYYPFISYQYEFDNEVNVFFDDNNILGFFDNFEESIKFLLEYLINEELIFNKNFDNINKLKDIINFNSFFEENNINTFEDIKNNYNIYLKFKLFMLNKVDVLVKYIILDNNNFLEYNLNNFMVDFGNKNYNENFEKLNNKNYCCWGCSIKVLNEKNYKFDKLKDRTKLDFNATKYYNQHTFYKFFENKNIPKSHIMDLYEYFIKCINSNCQYQVIDNKLLSNIVEKVIKELEEELKIFSSIEDCSLIIENYLEVSKEIINSTVYEYYYYEHNNNMYL